MDDGTVLAMLPVRVHASDVRAELDGAVVELQVHHDGLVTAEARIPAPQPEGVA